MKRLIAMFFIVAVVITGGKLYSNTTSSSCRADDNNKNMYVVKEDVLKIVDFFKDSATDLYDSLADSNKKAIESLYTKLKDKVPIDEFYLQIQKIISGFNNRNIICDYSPKNDRYINIPFRYINNRVIIVSNFGKFNKNDEITEIGQKSISTLNTMLREITYPSNDVTVGGNMYESLNSISKLKYLGLISDNSVIYKVKRNNNFVYIKIDVNSVKDTKLKQVDENYVINIDKNNDFAYIKINKWSKEVNVLDKKDVLENIYDNFFKKVKDNNIDNIVLDLTDNNDKNMDMFWSFISYLKLGEPDICNPTKNIINWKQFCNIYNTNENKVESKFEKYYKEGLQQFKGDIYIITSNKTSNASINVVKLIKQFYGCKVVGQETGGIRSLWDCEPYDNCVKWNVPIILSIQKEYYSLKQELQFCYETEDILKYLTGFSSIVPNIKVKTTVKDVLDNENRQLKAIIKMINNK